jgi:hypothetical protein
MAFSTSLQGRTIRVNEAAPPGEGGGGGRRGGFGGGGGYGGRGGRGYGEDPYALCTPCSMCCLLLCLL